MSGGATSLLRTFRDPAGSLRIEDDRVLRTVRPAFAAGTLKFLESPLARDLTDSGAMIPTQSLGFTEDGWLELEHQRVFFPSYPWEWCAEQWIDAALLTIDICNKLLDHDLILKDATPLNILFRASRPVLVDVLSIEPRDTTSPLWNAYGQFVRTFVLPLIAHKYLGWPLGTTRLHRDGYEPDELYPYLPSWRRYFGATRGMVTLPVLLDRFGRGTNRPPQIQFSREASTAVLRSRLRGLRRTVLSLRQKPKKSVWSDYTDSCAHYAPADRVRKEAFVKRALETARPRTVLDLGANTGAFSRMAAEAGARVVAVDTDQTSTAISYRKAHDHRQCILSLCADIARPTPSAGWKNRETFSLLDRCRRRFDCMFMLGLIHHLLVSDQIPAAEIASLVAELAPRWLVVEWIPPTDPKFVEICRGRDERYKDLTEDAFLQEFVPTFQVAEREALDNGRVLVLLRAR